VVRDKADALLACGDCRLLLETLPDESVQLVVTDPPHSDRMPYLELSEFWNSILGFEADFSREIVISNAKERAKTSGAYKESMKDVLSQVPRILSSDGVLVLIYNASESDEWEAFRDVCGSKSNTGTSGGS
jgi:adenine-specific DNA methylase